MSKVVNIVAGGLLLGVGLAFGGFAVPLIGMVTKGFLLSAGASLLLGGVAGLLQKGPARDAAEQQLQLGEVPRCVIVGEAAVDGSLVDAFNYGGSNGTDWEVLVIAVADCRCEALTGFYVNDTYVAFTGDGLVTGYKGQLGAWWRDGRWDQSPPSVLTANGPGWTANDRGRGVAYVVFAYKADKADAKDPVWSGRPRFRPIVKGARLCDPRADDTVGGDGAQRWNDQSTWTWTDNLIVARYNFVRGFYVDTKVGDPAFLMVGRGLSAAEAPPAHVFARANICDEWDGGEKRFRADGPIYANQAFIEVEELFSAACAGSVVTRSGSVEIDPGQARSVVATITDDDLLIGSTVEWNNGVPGETDREWVNTVVARYVEPAQRWSDHAAPVRRVDADLIADGAPREATITLRLVRRAKQAGEVAEVSRRLGRLWGRGAVTLGPRFCELEEGDWIAWTSARRFGGATRIFRIEGYRNDEKWQTRLTLREISAEAFDPVDELEDLAVAVNQDKPGLGAPGPGAWALTAEQLTIGAGAIPAIVISGAIDSDYASAIRFEYWPDDGATDPEDVTGWISSGTASPGTTQFEITSVAPGAVYYAAVSYLVAGEPTDRLILGPVTAGGLSGQQGAQRWVSRTVQFPFTPGDGQIDILAHDVTLENGAVVSLPSQLITGMAGSAEFELFWDLVGAAYVVATYPATADHQNAGYVFLEKFMTSTGGVFPAQPTPPPGSGGNGPGGWWGVDP